MHHTDTAQDSESRCNHLVKLGEYTSSNFVAQLRNANNFTFIHNFKSYRSNIIEITQFVVVKTTQLDNLPILLDWILYPFQ